METVKVQALQHTKKKGGRPTKRVKRTHVLVVRLTETERLLVEGKAREAGLSASAWFRAAAKKAVVMARLRPEEASLLRMLSGLANNFNQITRLAHREGLLSVQGRCRQLLHDIQHILQQVSRYDRKGDGR